MKTLHYYFALISPFAYLGHDALARIAERDDVKVVCHPTRIGAVFAATGGLPPAKRSPQRQAYRFAELRRWSARKALPLTLEPKHFPVDESLAAQCVLALQDAGVSPMGFIGRAHRATWAEERDLSDPAVVVDVLRADGQDAEVIVARAQDPATVKAYGDGTQAAIDAGVFGSPTYIIDGEVFWGQDRLDWVEAHLTD